jgi:DNA/RNA endonuclease YhcR with UshA esterase domain
MPFPGWTRSNLFRAVLLGMALSAMVIFQLVASRRAPPVVTVAGMKPFMNFTTVSVEGVLVEDARRLNDGSVLYVINDGTGVIPAILSEASGGENFPVGSVVRATGNLSVGANHMARLRILSPKHIVPALAGAQSNTFARLGGQLGRDAVVRGRVIRLWDPPEDSRAPHRIVLGEETGRLEVVHWVRSAPDLTVGDVVEVRGRVETYKGKLQFKVSEAEDITILPNIPCATIQ